MRKILIIFLEIFAVLAVLLLLGSGGVLWRLKSGPMDITFAKDYFINALNDNKADVQINFQKATLVWADLKQPIELELDDVEIFQNNAPVLSIEQLYFGILPVPLYAGKIRFKDIVLRQTQLHFVRNEDGSVVLKIEGEQALQYESDTSVEDHVLTDILESFSDQKANSFIADTPFAKLETISLMDTSLRIDDDMMDVNWVLPSMNIAFAKDARGLILSAELLGAENNAPLAANLLYSADQSVFKATLNLNDFNPSFILEKFSALTDLFKSDLKVSGTITAFIDKNLVIQSADGTISSDDPSITIPSLYETPLPLEQIKLDAEYSKENGVLNIKDAILEFDHFEIMAESKVSIEEGGEISAPVHISIPVIAQKDIQYIWPLPLKGLATEDWLTSKVHGGLYSDIEILMDVIRQPIDRNVDKTEPAVFEWTTQNPEATFGISNTNIDYRPPLMPITEASGKGTLKGERLTIELDTASIGDMKLTDSTLILKDFVSSTGDADIDINLTSDLRHVFNYVATEPIDVNFNKIGFQPDKAKGTAALNIKVAFPTSKDLPAEDVKVTIAGTVNDITLPNILNRMALTGGPYAFNLSDGIVSLKGKGALKDKQFSQGIDLTWSQYLDSKSGPYSSMVKARLYATKALRDRLDIDIEEWVQGNFPVNIDYTSLPSGISTVNVAADLTPATLFLDAFQYQKPAGQKASGRCQIKLKNDQIISVSNLDIITPELTLNNGLFNFSSTKNSSTVRSGTIESLKLDETDIGIAFESPTEDMLHLIVKGDFLDARPFLDGPQSSDLSQDDNQQSVSVSLAVNRMRTHPARMIERVKLYTRTDKTGLIQQFEMDALAGRGDIYLRLKPDAAGLLNLRLETSDAGATFQAFDLYDNMNGGQLIVDARSVSAANKHTLTGNLQLEDFAIIKAPVLARLLSALNTSDLNELAGQDGVAFGRLASEFKWEIGRQGDIYTLSDGRTSGSAIGLTFDGYIDKLTDEMNIAGTIVPISGLNRALSDIPLIGDILAGGKGGSILAATYTIKGKSKNPVVTVNPLAALTPGILRKVLFETDPNKQRQ